MRCSVLRAVATMRAALLSHTDLGLRWKGWWCGGRLWGSSGRKRPCTPLRPGGGLPARIRGGGAVWDGLGRSGGHSTTFC